MLTMQEMFNRAVIGLRSQGFEKCGDDSGCMYSDGEGKRCAWGWVDTSLGQDVVGGVDCLRSGGVGLASTLSADEMTFARALQDAHDTSRDCFMEEDLRGLGSRFGLTFPEG